MEFPFWAKSLPPPIDMFNILKHQELQSTTDKFGNSVLERKYPEDYISCDHISNHFTEYARILCKFGNNPTPSEVWALLKKEKDIKNMSPLQQREAIYNTTRECNTFNVSYCLWIITTLVGKHSKILDPSSGWGDRLIASLASEADEYHGFDPNKQLQKGYNKIIKVLHTSKGKSTKDKISVKPIPFEDSVLPTNYYDIALTSPTYFNLETYGSDPNQSIIKHSTYEQWLNFYKLYINKMISAVKPNGYIVIYIEDVTSNGIRYNMREFTIKTVNESKLAKNHRRLGLKVGHTIRYALVWQKISN